MTNKKRVVFLNKLLDSSYKHIERANEWHKHFKDLKRAQYCVYYAKPENSFQTNEDRLRVFFDKEGKYLYPHSNEFKVLVDKFLESEFRECDSKKD